MIRVREAIVVEGRYDKNTLRQLVDTVIVCTDGFQIFHDREKQELLRTLAERRGLIILTDADGAGKVIRGFLSGILDPSRVRHAYIPEIYGKERRKSAPSKEGTLGVEGMKPEVLLEVLRRAGATAEAAKPELTKAALYRLGLAGAPESAARRRALQRRLGLPSNLSANQLLDVLNALTTEAELASLLEGIPEQGQTDGPQEQDTGGKLQEHHGVAPGLRALAEEVEAQREGQHQHGDFQHRP